MKQIWKYCLLVMAAFLLVIGAAYHLPEIVTVSNNVYGREMPIQSAETKEKKAALTFECAWDHSSLNEILGALEAYHVRAAFFVTGDWVKRYPEDVRRIVQGGHDIGNHSATHRNLAQMEKEEIVQELKETHQEVKKLMGKDMKFFRPPYGAFNDTVILTAKEAGYLTVMGNIDSMDWKDYGAETIIRTVMEEKELKPGAIIRLNSEAKYTKEALPGLIENLQKQGYQLVPLSELLYQEEYHLDVKGRQIPDDR
ncbi:MAG: polysaccharide deacetylase family protein [Lachnospiraceae bacterium]|nr:polysaccharide deacetylase family protein [Lachnospiraceae bacterium]